MLTPAAGRTGLALLLLLLSGMALGACSRAALEVPCYRQCEATGKTFEEVEACRARCRVEE
jgi:hypothetical protein